VTLRVLLATVLSSLLATAARAEPTRDFTIAIFGDTQKMVRAVEGPPFVFPAIERQRLRRFAAMVDWVLDHRKAENIELVLHVGDAINAGIEGPATPRSDEEWRRFDSEWKRLDRAVPYLIARGNHDDPEGFARHYGKARFEKLAARFEDLDYLGSSAAEDAHALRLDLGGQPTLLLSVSCNPPPEELAFVRAQLAANAGLPAILVSHILTAAPGIHVRSTSASNPWCSKNAPGADLWSEIVLAHPGQVVLTASGHVVQRTIAESASKVVEEVQGTRVLDTYQNFQAFSDTPGGYYLTLVRVRPARGTVEVETISPIAREGDPEFPRRLVVEGRTHLPPTLFPFARQKPAPAGPQPTEKTPD
jgi:hypothetical protein